MLGATAAEMRDAVASVTATLRHPRLRAAHNAAQQGQCRRETPLVLKLPDGTLAEGVVDLAYLNAEGAWVVVDFKTDLTGVDTAPEAYRRQVQLYCQAVTTATGCVATGVLLAV